MFPTSIFKKKMSAIAKKIINFDKNLLRKRKSTLGTMKNKGILKMLPIIRTKEIWIKNFFVITFYVKVFIEKLKQNVQRYKMAKLNQIHYKIIGDISNENHSVVKNTLRDKLKKEYIEIIENSRSNILKFKLNLAKHCK